MRGHALFPFLSLLAWGQAQQDEATRPTYGYQYSVNFVGQTSIMIMLEVAVDTASKRSNSTYYNLHGRNTILTTPDKVCLVSSSDQCTCYALPPASTSDAGLLPLPEPITNVSFQGFQPVEGTETYGELTAKRLRLSVLTTKSPKSATKTDLTDEFDVSALLDATTGLPLVVSFNNETAGPNGQPARTEYYRDMRVGPLDTVLFEVPAFCVAALAEREAEPLQVLMNRLHYKPFAATVKERMSQEDEEGDEEKSAGVTAAAALSAASTSPLPPSSGSSDDAIMASSPTSSAATTMQSRAPDNTKDPVQSNIDIIKQHNKQTSASYQLTANRFLHVRPQAFFQRYALRAATPEEERAEMARHTAYEPSATTAAAILPLTLDRREEGKVTPVRDQGVCLSSYAQAAVAALETNVAMAGGALERLSVQSLVDCVAPGDGAVTCQGCNGGWPLTALGWVKEEGQGKLPLEDEQPYFEVQGACAATILDAASAPTTTKAAGAPLPPPPSPPRAPTDFVLTDFALVPRGDEEALAHAVVEHGSVVVTIEVRDDWLLYGGGVYDNPECTGRSLDHHLVVVGFTEDAWICKNSLGREWGEEGGYVRLARGKNMCGLANWAVVPIVHAAVQPSTP